MGNLSFLGLGLIQRGIAISKEVGNLPEKERIDVLNQIRLALHEVSPFRSEPTDCVLWVPEELVESNDYNPNIVAPPEMRLLTHSVEKDGLTQPIVTWLDKKDHRRREIVDGFHRGKVGRKSKKIRKRIKGYLPVTTINTYREVSRSDRMGSTIRHNRARGKHTVDGMSELVVELSRRNHSDAWIARELGMDADEVLRLKQISGLAEMFADREFSEAWEIIEDEM